MDDILAIITALTPIFLAWLGFYFRLKFKKMEINHKNAEINQKKIQEKIQNKHSNDIKLLIDKNNTELRAEICTLESRIEKMSKEFKEMMYDNDFKKKLKNELRTKSREIVRVFNSVLLDESKAILIEWENVIEELAVDFYHSNQRAKSEKKREEYLTSILDIKIRNFYQLIDNEKYKSRIHDNKIMKFSEFLQRLIVHRHTEILKTVLVKNGLSRHDLIVVFSDYIQDFFEEMIKAFQIWERLETVN